MAERGAGEGPSGAGDRRRNAGAAEPRPRRSPASRIILTVAGVLLATAAASAIWGSDVDDGSPHGRLLGALQRVAEAQEVHRRVSGEFTASLHRLGVAVPTGVRVTVIEGGEAVWKAVATDPEVGLTCTQRGSAGPDGVVRHPPRCYRQGPTGRTR